MPQFPAGIRLSLMCKFYHVESNWSPYEACARGDVLQIEVEQQTPTYRLWIDFTYEVLMSNDAEICDTAAAADFISFLKLFLSGGTEPKENTCL